MRPPNAPEPVADAPLSFMREDTAQMSFGERAALDGILNDLWPWCSVEIGVAQGGSLARISGRSTVVHAFDLAEPEELPKNVKMHVGDSHRLLPDVLAGLDRVAFALVDGDHSTEGARLDVEQLLLSPACAHCVILCHDSHNADVDVGVRLAVSSCPSATYYEPYFVPGYTFAHGPFAGQDWGGFALIVTGGTGPLSVQSLYGG